MKDHSLPHEITNLLDTEQHILNRLLGECVPIQEVADELHLSEDALVRLVDRLWLSLSIETKQQFVRFWLQHR